MSSIYQAMKLKTLVFVRNVPGNQDLVKDGRNGIVFNTPDVSYNVISVIFVLLLSLF